MKPFIDQTVYPDLDEPPADFADDYERADYLHRICNAWDFGVAPHRRTFEMFAQWKVVFDAYPVLTSPAYHTFRGKFGWEPIPWPENIPAAKLSWERMDELEGRGTDPCEGMI